MTHLPVIDYKDKITDLYKSGKNLIIKAPTGSGKSTQVPQFLLDSGLVNGKILILQPRRLAARMLAQRVADERSANLGGEIGFQTRFETMVSDATRACFITEGILPRFLLNDNRLNGVSAIIFDEFHERNLATDIGIALAVNLNRTLRPDLRIIVMSATIDTGGIAGYLENSSVIECSGRSFPIDIKYAGISPNAAIWDAAAYTVKNMIPFITGDILIFMPGVYEIKRTIRAIEETVHSERTAVFPLYGDLPAERQHEVMYDAPCRKIIVATNIAETSLTIPGVRHVIDSGLTRVNRYDPCRGLNTLFVEPISMNSADQRAGRAGREAPGTCIRLWSESQHAGRARRTTPEIVRVDLAETILYIKMIGYNAEQFPWFEKPHDAAITAGMEILRLLDAIDGKGEPTETGRMLSDFPMHPRLAKLLVEAGRRNAVELAAFAAAVLTERTAINGNPDYPELPYKSEVTSDIFRQYCLLKKVRESDFDPNICVRYSINASAARSIFRTQALFIQYCRRAGLCPHDIGDANSALARSMLAAYPDHLCIRKDQGTLICRMKNGRTGELVRESATRNARMIIAADIREIKTREGQPKTLLSMTSEIREEWLEDAFAGAWEETTSYEWNNSARAVECITRKACLGIVISEKISEITDTGKASGILAEAVISKALPIESWDNGVLQWINRVNWISGIFPEKNIPKINDESRILAIHALCEGETRYDRVKNKPVLPILIELLDYGQRRFVDEMAPQWIILSSGWKMRITYDGLSGPRGRARIQDLYGMNSIPVIAGGRAKVLMEILAPNNRPVQITDDLKKFWEKHYPDIKKTLSRRYPKHEWR
jgi:ATP-dependent helicase HrpB